MSAIGEKIKLSKGEFEIEPCKVCTKPMVNIDSDEIGIGDLLRLKLDGVRISNPETDEPVCIDCDIVQRPSRREALRTWYHSSSNDDSGWFGGGSSSGSSSGGGFSFGGFGGGGFSGGGASGGF